MQRRRCPVCRRYVAVRERGQLYRHGAPPHLLCPGSGFDPETLTAAMIPRSTSREGSSMADETTVETTTTEQTTTEQTTVEEPKPDEPKPDGEDGDEPTE